MTSRQQRPAMTLGVTRYDRTAPLIEGTVSLDNVKVVEIPGEFKDIFAAWNGVLTGELDAVEIPLGGYVLWKDQGRPVTAIPVFPDRLFVQQYVYVRRDAGIHSLADLRGRRVCMPQYNFTSSFWHRGTLKDDYGILPQEIEWYTTSAEAWATTLPEGVKVELRPSTFLGLGLLLDGTADCLMTEGTPLMTREDGQKVRRLHQDVQTFQRDYYRRTGYHVITHVIVVGQGALAKHPEFGQLLCEGFDQAKAQTYQMLQDERSTSLPLMRSFLDETMELFGDDPWLDGLEANRPVLDKFLEYAHDQGLCQRRYTPEELFDEQSTRYKFRARMSDGAYS